MISALSDISRTNQLKITEDPADVAERLHHYLLRLKKGIDRFYVPREMEGSEESTEEEEEKSAFYQERHRYIKQQIKARLEALGYTNWETRDIQYFLLSGEEGTAAYFLTPEASRADWKSVFVQSQTARAKFLSLIFRVHILSANLLEKAYSGLEELLLIHSQKENSAGTALYVWGHSFTLLYNYHNVVTLVLNRQGRVFTPKDPYITLDDPRLGEIMSFDNREYAYSGKMDARRKNEIAFMSFEKARDGFGEFKDTQLYHYQNLMTHLEAFLGMCGIAYERLPFQATHYLENRFVKALPPVPSLEIINNLGEDLSDADMLFLRRFFGQQGIPEVSFYHEGATLSTYERTTTRVGGRWGWRITEVMPWAEVQLEIGKNYLVFNKLLDEESGSQAYLNSDGLWYPAKKIEKKGTVDFYSQLKRTYSYLARKTFYSFQGINMPAFRVVGTGPTWSVWSYKAKKIEKESDSFYRDVQTVIEDLYLDIEPTLYHYLMSQEDSAELARFCKQYGVKVNQKLQKVVIEMGIKNWIRESLSGDAPALSIPYQTFDRKRFSVIYVRRQRYRKAQAVAVYFLYEDGRVYIEDVEASTTEIEKLYPFLRRARRASNDLVNQQYFVDEEARVYISSYIDDYYTPILIGSPTLIDDMEAGVLAINRRKSNKLLPLLMSYNDEVQKVKNLIYLDQKHEDFIQYYLPPVQAVHNKIKTSFRVYHLIGRTYEKEPLPTPELAKHPLTELLFSTFTQGILKMGENSRSSLLHKVAWVFIEN